jgi:hypothetical protein
MASWQPALPRAAVPVKTLMNLTTSIDSLAFSPDTQVLPRPTFCSVTCDFSSCQHLD